MGDLYHLLLINIIQIPKLRSKIENARTLFYFRVIIYLAFTIRVKITLAQKRQKGTFRALVFWGDKPSKLLGFQPDDVVCAHHQFVARFLVSRQDVSDLA